MKRIKLISLLILFATVLLLNSTTLFAQAKIPGSKISGKVVDQQQKTIDYATISLLKAKDSTLVKTSVTDLSGDYSFENVLAGNYLVSASMVGYKKIFSNFFTLNDSIPIIKLDPLQLNAENKTLKEVTIVAQKPFIERKMDKLVVNVENSSVSAGSTAMEVLEKAPGITIDKDDNISMKGKQGVLIMLDGKPTYLSSADVANMLRNMQSNQIESIELITSPSARYDAAGTSGIINIKTKKSKNMGLNGTLTAGGGYGLTSKYNGGTNLNFRKNKVNLFGNYNYSDNGRINNLDLKREVNYLDTLTNFKQLNNGDKRRNSNSFKGGADYFINKNHTIGVLVNGYTNTSLEESISNTAINNNFNQPKAINVDGHNKESYSNMAYNLNYKGALDTSGKELSVDLDYSNYVGEQDELRNNYYTNYVNSKGDPKDPLFIKNFAPSKIDIKSVKLDYTHPLNKTTKMEAGFKSSWVNTDNNLLLATLMNNSWVANEEYSNRFVYDENVYAGYLNYSKEFKKLGVQLGLRAEQTESKGNSITKNEVLQRNYLEFFPSVSLSHKINKNNELGLSYSRRIDRPAYDNLNPFLNFLDEYTFQKGNPFLRPQFTNSFDLSYTYKGSITTGLNFSRTKDAMLTVTEQDDVTKRTYAIERNIDKQDVIGLNIYAPVPLAKWWNMNNNLQVFYMSFKSTSNGNNINSGQTALTYNMNNSFTISKKLSAEASVRYQSPMQYGIFKIGSQIVVNSGLKTSFMNNKLNLRLSLNDIFNSQKQNLSTTYQNMNLSFSQKNESQIGRITLTYRFGKNGVKAARKRSTGLEDEANRMKN
ncbi:MAG: TonB-dependent receptor [Daejeonella sp.]